MKTLLPLALLGAIACDADSDGLTRREEVELGLDPQRKDTDRDGLIDSHELEIGTDPLDPDSDGDSLLDGDEVHAHGTDPLARDTDEDSYRDDDELYEGTDPTSYASRIYTGFWPYWRDKDQLGHKKFDGEPAGVGTKLFRLKAEDMFGDIVDLYDFAGPDAATRLVLESDAFW